MSWWQFTGNVQFDANTPAPPHSEGMVFYDNGAKALSYYNDDSDVTVNLGQESLIRVRNNTGSTILNGSVVSINGATGQFPTVELADASSSVNVIAVATRDIADNAWGYATAFGVVNGLNTSAFTEGATVYLDPENPGQFIEAVYAQESYAYKIGVVTYAHATQGKLLVDIDKQIVVGQMTVTNSVKLEGNDGRAITANTESIPFDGTGTGWVSGANGSSATSGNYYVVQNNDSIVSISVGLSLSVSPVTLSIYRNGSLHRTIESTEAAGTTSILIGNYISKKGEFNSGDKLAFISADSITLTNNTSRHYLNIVETAQVDAVVVEDASNENTNVRYSGGVTFASNLINWGTPLVSKGSVSTSDNIAFEIKETDVYTIGLTNVYLTAGHYSAILLNSTSFTNLEDANVLDWDYTANSTDYNSSPRWTGELQRGDVIRIYGSTAPSTNRQKLTISKASKRNIMQFPLGGDENVYSARIANAGVASITSQNFSFIESVSRTGAGVVVVTFKAGFFTTIPAIFAEVTNGASNYTYIGSITTSGCTVRTISSSGTLNDSDFSLLAHRQGADYKPASAKAFATSSDLQYYYPVETQIGWYGAKALYARSFTVESNITATLQTIATIDTNLNVINAIKIGTDVFALDIGNYMISPINYTFIRYTQSTGLVEVRQEGRTLYAGTTFTIKYTKP